MRKECSQFGECQVRGSLRLRDLSAKEWVVGKVFTVVNVCIYLIADIHHYVTPVRTDRIIVELGGHLDWQEASSILTGVANLLPFAARFVSQDLLDTEDKIRAYVAAKNVNPFYPPGKVMLKNYAGSRSFTSPWHLEWCDPNFK